jgi:hypothetical protein
MNEVLTRIGYSDIKIVSLRDANKLYLGSEDIEETHYFATTETENSKPDSLMIGTGGVKRNDRIFIC